MDSRFEDAIGRIVGAIEKYSVSSKNLEYEFRLGYVEDGKFNSEISDDFYEKILSRLGTNPNWKSKDKLDITDYFLADIRYSVFPDKTECIKKTKLVQLDFRYENTPFDIRFCISKEEPVNKKVAIKDANYSRKKNRSTFKHKYWTYDISKVETITNGVKEITNEVELDVIIEPTMDLKYIVYSSLLKVSDIANMCEKVEKNAKFNFIGSSDKKK